LNCVERLQYVIIDRLSLNLNFRYLSIAHTQQKLSSIASCINVTSKSHNETTFLINWNSSAKQNNIKTYYIISVIEIVNSTDFIDRKYYCNKTSPFEANYKRYNICQNKSNDFILGYVEHEFEDKDNFINIIIDVMTDKQKKNNSLLRWEKHNKFTLKYFYIFKY
jgi:hypothetical protein